MAEGGVPDLVTAHGNNVVPSVEIFDMIHNTVTLSVDSLVKF